MSIQSGIEFDKYQILEQLEESGLSVWYKAHDTQLDADVILQFIQTEYLKPQDRQPMFDRFQPLAKQIVKMHHPYIVPYTGFGEYEGMPYLAMPYMPGKTLRKQFDRPIPWRDAMRLLQPIVEALSYIHGKGFLHGNLNPSNILISESDYPLLSGFGVTKILIGDKPLDLDALSLKVAIPEYIAPEQAEGKPIDERSDEYSFGVLLYELITGQLPFNANSPMGVIAKLIHDPLPMPTSFVADLPMDVEEFLIKVLSKDPEDRFRSMAEVLQTLKKLITDEVPVSKEKLPARSTLTPDLAKKAQPIPIKLSFEKLGNKLSIGNKKISWRTIGTGILLIGLILFAVVKIIDYQKNLNPEIGSEKISDIDGMTLLYIPAGEFLMGSGEDDQLAFADEFPQQEVYLDAFWMDQTEVTNSQYRMCVEAGACEEPADTTYFNDSQYDDHPAVAVDWDSAMDYCQWAERELPTEAQWEKAARGTDGRIYPWGNIFNSLAANVDDETVVDENRVECSAEGCDGYDRTSPVGSFPEGASPFYIMDMVGNVWEWTLDVYSESYYSNSEVSDSANAFSSENHVIRGGSWLTDGLYASRVAYRSATDRYHNDVGFRCVLPIEPEIENTEEQSLTTDESDSVSEQQCQIAFTSERDGDDEIFVMDADGSNQTQLTFNEETEWDPTWSPDGKKIAFVSGDAGKWDIFVMEAEGNDPVQLTYNEKNEQEISVSLAWMPDGKQIVFDSFYEDGWEIFKIAENGSNPMQLTSNNRTDIMNANSISPDGKYIVYTEYQSGDYEIYVMDTDGGEKTQLTFNDSNDEFSSWSPDGRRIAFTSDRDGDWEIYIMDADGSNQTQLTFNDSADWGPIWSPDGKYIAFDTYRDDNNEIFLIDLDTNKQIQLTDNDVLDDFESWSPDGQRIAFTSYRDGDWEIYIMDADGSNQTQLTYNDYYDSSPVWSPQCGVQ